jgi:FMN-dependent NADH-azoreductase
MNVLHIDSSPLAGRSVSRDLSARIVASIKERFPDATIVSRDVGLAPPAHAAADILDLVRFHRFDGLTASQIREKVVSDTLVTELLAADIIVIGAPMYNFTITTQLKAWFDRVCQAGSTFRYTPEGPVGLAVGKKAIVAASRGGVYATGSQSHRDFQVPYLREILAFMGIVDVAVVLAEGVNISPENRTRALDQAHREIDAAVCFLAGSSATDRQPAAPHVQTS